MTKSITKLWGTAFSKTPKNEAVNFAAGRDVQSLPAADELLIPYEIKASLAYVNGLKDQKIIDQKTYKQLISGLKKLEKEYQSGKFKFDPQKEDVHTNIESWLIQKLGIDVAGKIHSGRSRNEQGIVDVVLYIKSMNDIFKKEINKLIKVLDESAKQYQDILIPGYTHHQPATITTFGEILDCYSQAFSKDLKKFNLWNETEEINPLGASAGYASSYPISKNKINQYLKLKQVFQNSIQVITFKGDAETQMVFNLAVFMNHLSSLAQTLIIFSTKEFGFISISDEYSTGSSIMPQKKNPDPLEVMKAKASMCHGYLMSLLSLTKAAFIGYNRDLQWTKYLVMDAVNECLMAPKIMAGIIKTLKVNAHKMAKQTIAGFILAQSIMENLAIEFKLPMRLAKLILEETVKQCQTKGISSLNTVKELHTLNKIIKQFKLNFQVKEKQFSDWIDPYQIVEKQIKN